MSAEGRGRGRPRSFDPEAALQSVRRAFWDGGFSATSLDDLSAATGLNRPSLYGAFGDKRALYLAALNRSREESLAGLAQALGAPTLRQALQQVWAAAIRIYLAGEAGARGCFVIGTAVVEAVSDPDVRRILAETEAGLDERFAARFAQAVAEGELGPHADSRGLALVATATLNTLSIRARAGAAKSELEAVAAAATDILCR